MRQWFLYLLLFLPTISFATEANTDNDLTLEQAIINVLEHSPSIKAADFEAMAAASRIRAARRSPAYRASIDLENFAGSGVNSGKKNLETTLNLSRVLELGDKSRLRGELAGNKAMMLRNDQDAKRLDLLAQTANRFIQVVTNQERLKIAKDSSELAKKTRKVVSRRVNAGKSPTAELRRAKMAAARKQLLLKQAERELDTSRLKLTILWGEASPQFRINSTSLLSVKQITTYVQLLERLENNPDLIRFASEKRLAETRIRLAKSSRRPDIDASAGLRHLNADDDIGFVLSLDIPLGAKSRAIPEIEEAELLQLSNPEVYKERQLALQATLFEVHQNIKQAMDTLSTLRETIIPQAKRALRDYENGYAAGRYSFLELTEAQRILLDSRLEAIMAATDYYRYQIEIDRLTGAGLSTGVNP